MQGAAATGFSWTAVGRSAMAASATTSAPHLAERRLVVVMLRGAVDGLSIVAPYSEEAYYDQRPSIALARPGQDGGLFDLDGHFGLNPSLAALMPLWQQQKLAFVHACGSHDPTRSHFDAQDFMESGTPGVKSTPDGWLNRLLGALSSSSEPTNARHSSVRGLSAGASLPRIWSGRNPVTNIALGNSARVQTLLDREPVGDAFDALYAGSDPMSSAYQQSRQSRAELAKALSNARMNGEQMSASNGAPLPAGFPADAARLAQLIRHDRSIQLAFVALGGWDTHVNQGSRNGQLATRLRALGQGLAALASGLGPAFAETTVLVMSEFGRTAKQNGTGGTDHGHGNVMWALGGTIAGGRVYGRWPGIDAASLYEGRDLAVTTDFRQVLAGVCSHALGLSDSQLDHVLPGFSGSSLGITVG